MNEDFEHGYKAPPFNARPVIAFLVTSMIGGSIFLLLPLTQAITGSMGDRDDLVQVNVAPPPPTILEEEEPPEDVEEEEPPPPELTDPPPPLDLTQLELSLNPSVDFGAGGQDLFSAFEQRPDAIGEMKDLFNINELDDRPTLKNRPNFDYPYELKRNRIPFKAKVEIIIAKDGRVESAEVREVSHPGFRKPAIEGAMQMVFTPPTKNGRPVRARYLLPIEIGLR